MGFIELLTYSFHMYIDSISNNLISFDEVNKSTYYQVYKLYMHDLSVENLLIYAYIYMYVCVYIQTKVLR